MDTSLNQNIISLPSLTTPNPKGVGHVYYQSMLKYRNRIAQIDAITGEEQSYDTLFKRSVRIAVAMQNKGIKAGDFISVCSYNHLDCCLPYIGSQLIGAIMAAVEPSMSVTEISSLLSQVSPKIIFVENEAVKLIEQVVENLKSKTLIVVFGETTIHSPFSEFLAFDPKEIDFCPREAESLDETVLVVFSSGTTGKPKGICHTHTSILSNDTLAGRDYMTIVSFTSLYWSIFPVFLHISITNGFGRRIYPRFDINDPWSILKYKTNYMFLNILQCLLLLNTNKPDYVDVANLEYVVIAGGPMSKENILKLRALLPKTIVHYVFGQTEVFKVILEFSITPEGERLAQKYCNSVGTALSGLSYKIVDINTNQILGPNQQGELCLKSKCQAKGLYNCNSSDMFDSDGWLKTGDMAYYNEENCFFITNRIKDSFKYRNLHIISTDIEEVLSKHVAIKFCAVIGLPHETEVNHPMGVVVLREELQNVTAEELIEYVNERVEDKNRLRGGVRFVKEIPMTITGKINRFKLREMVINDAI